MDHEYPLPPDDEIIPHNTEAEHAVIGSILQDEDAFDIADQLLHGQEFYHGSHTQVFTAARELRDEGIPIDLVTITEKLQEKNQIEHIGVGYLTQVMGSVPTTANIEYYIRIVKQKYSERFASTAIKKAMMQASKGNFQEVISGIQETALTLADQSAEKTEFKPIGQVAIEVFEQIEHRWMNKDRGLIGVTSGFKDLDHMTGGFQKSDLIIVAARPSVGKTAFALNIATNAAASGKETVVIFSLEMSAAQLVQRMVCAEGSIDAGRVQKGYLESDDWERLTMAVGQVSNCPILIDDSPSLTVQDIRAKCRRLKKTQGLGLIIIDYLQLISGRGRRANRQEEVADISRTLKQIARELEVPVIALSQLSRGVEQRQDKRPLMSDLRESGSIEQDADIVMFLYRQDYYDAETEKKGIIEIIISKQRNGPTGTVELVFLKNFNKFANYDRGHHEPRQTRNQPDMAARYG